MQGGGDKCVIKDDKKEKLVFPELVSGRPLVLTQACMAVILYDSDRNVIQIY